MEAKDKIRARVGFSPDVGDALALTFAETAHDPVMEMSKINPLAGGRSRGANSWMGVHELQGLRPAGTLGPRGRNPLAQIDQTIALLG